ncbi:M23 family metallopeptidase [Flavobacterium gelatinilyticum]|uniref:M23 family metallopeptidase n=1 Tax=Flavobacterium gelatinilyticum TaxID=3003260 RepID=UPI002480A78A|nr:M23 family metallopeptidase [Flavobacterium gelatinilyticum]
MKHIKSTVYAFAFAFLLTSCAEMLMGDEGKFDEEVYLNYKTKTVLELPFEDDWYIAAGGKSLEENHHFSPNRHQRYALDMVQIINRRGNTGDGTKNEDYYCFGKRLNAPGDGKIIAMENTIEDNVPGVKNTKQTFGNYIIIDHLNGEYSFMLHLKKNSIIVEVGDAVVRGQKVGLAGNSGYSTGPHLHYHLQTTSSLATGTGLPMQFVNYYADDVFTERGEPVTSQTVRKN